MGVYMHVGMHVLYEHVSVWKMCGHACLYACTYVCVSVCVTEATQRLKSQKQQKQNVPAQRLQSVPGHHSGSAECWKMQSLLGHDPRWSPAGVHNAARTQMVHYSYWYDWESNFTNLTLLEWLKWQSIRDFSSLTIIITFFSIISVCVLVWFGSFLGWGLFFFFIPTAHNVVSIPSIQIQYPALIPSPYLCWGPALWWATSWHSCVQARITWNISGSLFSLVPLTRRREGGPQPVSVYTYSLNHSELTCTHALGSYRQCIGWYCLCEWDSLFCWKRAILHTRIGIIQTVHRMVQSVWMGFTFLLKMSYLAHMHWDHTDSA